MKSKLHDPQNTYDNSINQNEGWPIWSALLFLRERKRSFAAQIIKNNEIIIALRFC